MSRLILAAAVVVVGVGGAAFNAARPPAEPAAAETEAASANGFSIQVDLSARQLHVKNGSEIVASYPVAIGAAKHPTPKGTFAIRRIIWNPKWVPPDEEWAKNRKPTPPGHPDNPMGKVKIFFRDPDYYIHGTRDVDSLGRAASHGCIRMRNADVIAVAKRMMANGGAERPSSWFRRVVNRVRSTQEVRLSSPVTVRITA